MSDTQTSEQPATTQADVKPVQPAPTTGTEGNPANSASTGADPAANQGTKTPWAQKVIAQKDFEAREARREANALKAQNIELANQLTQVRSGQPAATPAQPATQPTTAVTNAEIEARANARAQQLLQQQSFDQQCNNVWERGIKEVPDFKQAMDETFSIIKMTPSFMQTVVNLQDPHKLLYTLAKNPEEADRIMSLDPQKQAIELARMESKVAGQPITTVSSAPPPITPIEGRRVTGPMDFYDTDRISTDEWVRARSEQKRQKIQSGYMARH